ncbi:alpha/beta hydrolase [Gemmobacter sp.]|uniref:alpha/beta fold hydrolase n=1 Tax=Gemmobacter sp. TaxID=1898957 RepID=UPI0025BE8AB1|nr:alpha/beta hydrolase [Gemmobacter sp.]
MALEWAALGAIGGAIGGALGLAGLTTLRARRRERRYEARFPPLGRVVTVEGKRLHLWQAGSGPDLVMIHGSSANLREFTMGLAPALTDRFRVTLVDRPGLGWSDDAGDSPAAQARLIRLGCAAAGVTRPLVLGHSYGGAVALAWGLQAPVAGLVILSGVAMPWPGGLGPWYAATATALGRALIVPLVTAFVPRRKIEASIAEVFAPQNSISGYAYGPDGQAKRIEDYAFAAAVPLILRRKALATNARQVNRLLQFVREMAPQYHTISAPVEILHGDSDTIVPHHIHALPLAERLPDAALTLLPGVGHMPHQTHPAEVTAAVLRLAGRAGLALD